VRADREIWRLAVPALGALVAEPLFQLADAAIVGHLGAAQLAGFGAAAAALATLVNVCIFLAYGTTSAVARLMGAGQMRAAVQQGIDGMWVAALLGTVLSGVVFVLDGVLIGAGDNRFLAVASVLTTGVFAVCAYVSLRAGGGLTGLWLAIGAFMLARLVVLGLRARSPAWTVTGARRL
jgi:Na+-driven multidrug efflux pump